MVKDALKFFQAFLIEMIDIGGENLPRTISTKLGGKLGQIYKKRGIISIEKGLKQMYKVLKCSSRIKKIDENNFEVKLKYRKQFCSIGGEYDPHKSDLIQQSLCYPYTYGFLNELDHRFKYSITLKECILTSNKGNCYFLLNLEKKENLIIG